MNILQAVASVLGQYASFEGRATRSEYWWWVVFSVAVNWITGLIDVVMFGPFSLLVYGELRMFTPISTLVGLALIIPSLAVGARRFHDMDRSGWWLLIGFSGIGAVVIFFWFMMKGTDGPNRFGPDPLSR
ncbi:DUF805 domain-containing protein [Ancylobacter terrae]|uniref:DUF805 domain-containing protein n=1 Tax=Ancylobacter sp. sgz301288 TaxID=3342077 RepID=UPI00385BBC7A